MALERKSSSIASLLSVRQTRHIEHSHPRKSGTAPRDRHSSVLCPQLQRASEFAVYRLQATWLSSQQPGARFVADSSRVTYGVECDMVSLGAATSRSEGEN